MSDPKSRRQTNSSAPSSHTRVRVNAPTLSRTEGRRLSPVRTVKQKNYVMETRIDPVRKPFPYAVIGAIVGIVIVAMYVLSLRVTLDSLTTDISRMEREIAACLEEKNALEVRLNAKYDLTEIERIAKDEYGMVGKDTLTKKYISVSGEDEIEILDGKKTETEEENEDEESEEPVEGDEAPAA